MLYHGPIIHFLYSPLHGYNSFCLSQQSVGIHIAFTIWLLWTLVYQCLFEHLFLILWGIYFAIKLLTGWYGNSRFNILRTQQTDFHSGCTIYILTSNVQGFKCLHILVNTYFLSLFFVVLGLEIKDYTLIHSTSSFLWRVFFWDRISQIICLDWLQTMILLSS
jgi:hypothetical protein